MADLEFSDSVFVAQDPEQVYALVSDVTRMGEWSPQCRACWWDDSERSVGAWFTGRNETPAGRSEATGEIIPERTWETRSQVVAAEPGREFAWEVNSGWVRWGFSMERESMAREAIPAGRSEAPGGAIQGTRLTESWHFLPKGIAGFRERFGDDADEQIAKRTRSAHTGIPETLAAIKKAAEAD